MNYDPDEMVTSIALVTLLEADGTPTGERRWDRKLRLDGNIEHVNAMKPSVWLRLAEGEPGLWRWIAAHVSTGGNTIMPIAVKIAQHDEQRGWVQHVLPRLNLHEAPDSMELLDDRSWPVWLQQGVENPNWSDERFQETPLAWFTIPERPTDAPPPMKRGDLDRLPVEAL